MRRLLTNIHPIKHNRPTWAFSWVMGRSGWKVSVSCTISPKHPHCALGKKFCEDNIIMIILSYSWKRGVEGWGERRGEKGVDRDKKDRSPLRLRLRHGWWTPPPLLFRTSRGSHEELPPWRWYRRWGNPGDDEKCFPTCFVFAEVPDFTFRGPGVPKFYLKLTGSREIW